MKRKASRGVHVKHVQLAHLLQGHEGQSVHVGFDVGKRVIYCVLRWNNKDYSRPWVIHNPAATAATTGRAYRRMSPATPEGGLATGAEIGGGTGRLGFSDGGALGGWTC